MLLLDHLHPILGSTVDTWATVFVAIGTVGAVAYALFRDLFVVARRRPKLDLRLEHAGNDQVVVAAAGGFDAECVRLRVANGAGKDTADDVVVMVTEVRGLEDLERVMAQTKLIGLPLTWSGSNPPLAVASVHPGSERHTDLRHVDWPTRDEIDIARKWSETVPVQLGLTPKPAGGQEILDSGTDEILLRFCRRARSSIWPSKLTGPTNAPDQIEGAGHKRKVSQLVSNGGLQPLDVGQPARAQQLEHLGFLHIALQQPHNLTFGSAIKLHP